MGVLAASLLPLTVFLLLLAGGGAQPTRAAGMVPDLRHPSLKSRSGCPSKCGNLTFSYPFGLGHPRCFRDGDFELICNVSGQHPRLFLRNGGAEVLESIDRNYGIIQISPPPPSVITVGPADIDANFTWKNYGFLIIEAFVEITSHGFDIYSLQQYGSRSKYTDINPNIKDCTFDTYSMDTDTTNSAICKTSISFAKKLKFSRINGSVATKPQQPNESSLWDTINVTTTSLTLMLVIRDQPNCSVAETNKTNYACLSKYSYCVDAPYSAGGYACRCKDGYMGNPYIVDGCSLDFEYNPTLAREDNKCRRTCGDINIEFPFGLEEECYARVDFRLKCTDGTAAPPVLMIEDETQYNVSSINISEGTIQFKHSSNNVDLNSTLYDYSSFVTESVQWAVASLTCEQAWQNRSSYACQSNHSECSPVNFTSGNLGYRCKCSKGFYGNPYILNGCQDVNECETSDPCKGKRCHNTEGSYRCSRLTSLHIGLIIGSCIVFGVLLLGLSAAFLVHKWRVDANKKIRKKYFRNNQGLLLEQLISSDANASNKTKIFSLDELEKATNNFDQTRILGRGGHGMVYKGILSDQRVVAIKRSNITHQSEIKQFINEVAILSQINHRNIVKLFGCCLETQVPLLVYDFVPNGSLSEALHSGAKNGFHLSWDDCLRIATETAGALCYLHSAASVSVFHRDIKSSNILLDANFTAKVSDFGCSRLVSVDQTHVSTLVQGTFGYLDPQYYHTGLLNEKSDVYSFGVVLLELLLRKEPVFTSESGLKQNLSRYFLEVLNTMSIMELVAAPVLEEAAEEEIKSVATLAEKCLKLQGEERPTMKEVEMTLHTIRTKRFKQSLVAARNNEVTHQLIYPRARYTIDQSVSHGGYSLDQVTQMSYGLEQELLSSAEIPR